MSFPVFGPGILIATRTDVAGTPVNIGYANEFSVDFAGNIKQLFGQNQFPIDAARGTVKIGGKAKNAVVSGLALNAVFFGNSFTSGGIKWNVGEAHTIPATTPFLFPVTNSATFDQDLGVVYTSTGIPFAKQASAVATANAITASSGTTVTLLAPNPAIVTGMNLYDVTSGKAIATVSSYAGGLTVTISAAAFAIAVNDVLAFYTAPSAAGQYAAAGGAYFFNTADAGVATQTTYTSTVASGIQTLNITNQLIGTSPIFQLDYYTIRNNKALVARFYQVQAAKLGLNFKLEDFMMPEMDFELFANSAGSVANITFGDLG